VLVRRSHGDTTCALAAGVRRRPPRHYTRATADRRAAEVVRFRREDESYRSRANAMSRAPALSGEFDLGSQIRSSLMGWREVGMK
jgi:hypothetical protein